MTTGEVPHEVIVGVVEDAMTWPELVTENTVVEALFTTSNALLLVASAPQTERVLYGVVVPIPTNLVPSKVMIVLFGSP